MRTLAQPNSKTSDGTWKLHSISAYVLIIIIAPICASVLFLCAFSRKWRNNHQNRWKILTHTQMTQYWQKSLVLCCMHALHIYDLYALYALCIDIDATALLFLANSKYRFVWECINAQFHIPPHSNAMMRHLALAENDSLRTILYFDFFFFLSSCVDLLRQLMIMIIILLLLSTIIFGNFWFCFIQIWFHLLCHTI